jgi:hypothetical protein
MFNNQNIIYDRQKNISSLYDFFFDLQNSLVKKMLENLNSLRLASYGCLKYLEGFSYTNISRSTWKALNEQFPCRTEFTGIPGTSEMGMNIHQESWVILNKSLDLEEEYNKNFSMSLMVASASNPKGSRHVRNQFDSAKKLAEDRRKKLAKEGFIDTSKWTPEGWAASVDTTEEIVAELERQMTGVKDKHDVFMEDYMRKVREQAERKTREAQERISKYQESHDNVFIDGEQRAMTDSEVRTLMGKKTRNTEIVAEEILTPEDKNKFLNKIGSRILTAKN